MSLVLIDEASLIAIAPEIRAKLGVETLYRAQDMAAAVASIETGGGGGGGTLVLVDSVTNNGTLEDFEGSSSWSGRDSLFYFYLMYEHGTTTKWSHTFSFPNLEEHDYVLSASMLILPSSTTTSANDMKKTCATCASYISKRTGMYLTSLAGKCGFSVLNKTGVSVYGTNNRAMPSALGFIADQTISAFLGDSITLNSPSLLMQTGTYWSTSAANSLNLSASEVRLKYELYEVCSTSAIRTIYEGVNNRLTLNI